MRVRAGEGGGSHRDVVKRMGATMAVDPGPNAFGADAVQVTDLLLRAPAQTGSSFGPRACPPWRSWLGLRHVTPAARQSPLEVRVLAFKQASGVVITIQARRVQYPEAGEVHAHVAVPARPTTTVTCAAVQATRSRPCPATQLLRVRGQRQQAPSSESQSYRRSNHRSLCQDLE